MVPGVDLVIILFFLLPACFLSFVVGVFCLALSKKKLGGSLLIASGILFGVILAIKILGGH